MVCRDKRRPLECALIALICFSKRSSCGGDSPSITRWHIRSSESGTFVVVVNLEITPVEMLILNLRGEVGG